MEICHAEWEMSKDIELDRYNCTVYLFLSPLLLCCFFSTLRICLLLRSRLDYGVPEVVAGVKLAAMPKQQGPVKPVVTHARLASSKKYPKVQVLSTND